MRADWNVLEIGGHRHNDGRYQVVFHDGLQRCFYQISEIPPKKSNVPENTQIESSSSLPPKPTLLADKGSLSLLAATHLHAATLPLDTSLHHASSETPTLLIHRENYVNQRETHARIRGELRDHRGSRFKNVLSLKKVVSRGYSIKSGNRGNRFGRVVRRDRGGFAGWLRYRGRRSGTPRCSLESLIAAKVDGALLWNERSVEI